MVPKLGVMRIRIFEIYSNEKFITLKNQYPFLKVFSEDLIIRYLSYETPVVIEETETKKTLLSKVSIKTPQKIKDVLEDIQKAKSNTAEYAKDALQNGDNCKIELIRKKIIKIYNILGRNWYKKHAYIVDKYAPFRDQFNKSVFGRWISHYDYLIIDHKGQRKIVLGKKLADVLYHSAIEREVCIAYHDFGRVLTQIMECFTKRGKLVLIDMQPFEKKDLMVGSLLSYTKKGNYEIKNADCTSIGLHMQNASITLINCKVDALLHYSKNVEVKIAGGGSIFEPFKGAENIKKKEIRGFRIYKLKGEKNGKG